MARSNAWLWPITATVGQARRRYVDIVRALVEIHIRLTRARAENSAPTLAKPTPQCQFELVTHHNRSPPWPCQWVELEASKAHHRVLSARAEKTDTVALVAIIDTSSLVTPTVTVNPKRREGGSERGVVTTSTSPYPSDKK
ncbi:hypothetical protein HD554DRAFT_2038891 [Boletus coccyginus]|nr:hypothetical protein HD554DRAFT_2038891 [Boletus coccyginus]